MNGRSVHRFTSPVKIGRIRETTLRFVCPDLDGVAGPHPFIRSMKRFFTQCRHYRGKLDWATLRRIGVAIAGGCVVLVGIAMIVLPGPAFLVIPLGLGILASEFDWAKRWLKKVRDKLPKRKNLRENK